MLLFLLIFGFAVNIRVLLNQTSGACSTPDQGKERAAETDESLTEPLIGHESKIENWEDENVLQVEISIGLHACNDLCVKHSFVS